MLQILAGTRVPQDTCNRRESAGPSRKAKYSRLTDSELVPRGKGESTPVGSEKYLKPYAYKQWEHYAGQPERTAPLYYGLRDAVGKKVGGGAEESES